MLALFELVGALPAAYSSAFLKTSSDLTTHALNNVTRQSLASNTVLAANSDASILLDLAMLAYDFVTIVGLVLNYCYPETSEYLAFGLLDALCRRFRHLTRTVSYP